LYVFKVVIGIYFLFKIIIISALAILVGARGLSHNEMNKYKIVYAAAREVKGELSSFPQSTHSSSTKV
jgi:hypothetical protein